VEPAFLGNSSFLAVYTEDDETGMYYILSDDNGDSWSSPILFGTMLAKPKPHCFEPGYCLVTTFIGYYNNRDVLCQVYDIANKQFSAPEYMAPWNNVASYPVVTQYADAYASIAYLGNNTYAAAWETKFFDKTDTTIALAFSFNRGLNWTYPVAVNEPLLDQFSRWAQIARVGPDVFMITYHQLSNAINQSGTLYSYNTYFPYHFYRISEAISSPTTARNFSRGILGGIKRNFTFTDDGSFPAVIGYDGAATSISFFAYNFAGSDEVFASTTFGLPECYPNASLSTTSSLTCMSASTIDPSGSLVISVTAPTVYLGVLSLKGSDNLNISSSLSVSGNLVLSGSSGMTMAVSSSVSINGTSSSPYPFLLCILLISLSGSLVLFSHSTVVVADSSQINVFSCANLRSLPPPHSLPSPPLPPSIVSLLLSFSGSLVLHNVSTTNLQNPNGFKVSSLLFPSSSLLLLFLIFLSLPKVMSYGCKSGQFDEVISDAECYKADPFYNATELIVQFSLLSSCSPSPEGTLATLLSPSPISGV